MGVIYRNFKTGETREFAEPDFKTAHDRDWVLETDDRTVLHALPEDQPDHLSEGHTSHQADLDKTPAQKGAGNPSAPAKAAAPASEAPAKSATKAAWVDFAVASGAKRAEAEAMTKDDLQSAYGG